MYLGDIILARCTRHGRSTTLFYQLAVAEFGLYNILTLGPHLI